MRKFILLIIILIGLLVSCDSDDVVVQPTLPSEEQVEQEKTIWSPFPLEDTHQLEFISWGKDDTLLVTTTGSKTVITEYNAHTKEKLEIYQTESFIQSVHYYEQSERYVIVESPSTYEARITILNNDLHTILSKSVPSTEISINATDLTGELLLAVTAFKEDWSYESFVYASNSWKEIENVEPFFYLKDKDSVVQQMWESETSYIADLVEVDVNSGDQKVLLEDVYSFSVYEDKWIVITVNEGNKETLTYSVYNDQMEKELDATIPALAQYGDYFLSDYTLTASNDLLFWSPLENEDADAYRNGFKLFLVSEKNTDQIEMDFQEWSKPLSCQKKGDLCIIGGDEPIGFSLKIRERFSLIEE